MSKKVSISAKPPKSKQPDPDAWVENRQAPPRPKTLTKRMTLDLDAELHRRMKMRCAEEGVRMVDVVRDLIELRFPAEK